MAETKKILLVDDDNDFRSATRTILESRGYEVIEAATGKEGFEKAKSESPDLAVIDIIMESFSEGFNLIKRLGQDEWTRGIPRIVLTSLGLQQDSRRATVELHRARTHRVGQAAVGVDDRRTLGKGGAHRQAGTRNQGKKRHITACVHNFSKNFYCKNFYCKYVSFIAFYSASIGSIADQSY